MPSGHVAVRVSFVEMAEEYGLWCEACSLPGVFDVVLLVTFDGRPGEVVHHRECVDCGRVYLDGMS